MTTTPRPFTNLPADAITGPGDYWDIIEAALVGLPETDRLRASALASLDHLKERVNQPQERNPQ